MSIGAAIGAGLASSIGSALGNAIGSAFKGGGSSSSSSTKSSGGGAKHGSSPNTLGGKQAPGGGYGGIGNSISSGGGAASTNSGGSSNSGLWSNISSGIGSAISGFGTTAANHLFNKGQGQGQPQAQTPLGVFQQQPFADPISGKESGTQARDFMQTLYGDDVSPWDWLNSSNSANSGATQAPQLKQDRDRLRTEERIARQNNQTQRYVSDNAVKATQYAADTSADAARYGSDKTYAGVERVQSDPYRQQLLTAQAAESRIRAKFDQAQIAVAKQDAILREFQTYMTKAMTDHYKELAMATGDQNQRDWNKLPKELRWLDQQALTSEQQRVMLEVGNWWQTMRTALPKVNLFGWTPFDNGDDGTQALADLLSINIWRCCYRYGR